MEAKDSLANLTSFGALGMAMADIESVLTIILLVSAIALNILRFRQTVKNKKEE